MAANPATQKLKSMVDAAPDQVVAIEKSIASVGTQIDDLNAQASAITGAVTDVAETDAITYITNNILPLYPGGYIVYGPTFGTITYGPPKGNISDWSIWTDITPVPPPILPPVPTLAYPYTPGDYPDLDELVSDYAFGNDYLTRPLTTGATYGLGPAASALTDAKNLLQENSDKVEDSIDVFTKYL